MISPHSSELITIPQFSLVLVHDPKSPNEEWTVTYSSQTGNVPSSILRKIARGLYEYIATADDELTIRPGEIIGITAHHEGWISAVNQLGAEGLVPTPYLEML